MKIKINLFSICLLLVAIITIVSCKGKDTDIKTETNNPANTPVPTLTASPTPEPTPFSFMWVGDTQLVPYTKGRYDQMAEWAIQKIEEKNVVYMLGTGDYVDAFPAQIQWERFHKFLDPVREKIPVVAIAGNHDINYHIDSYDPFRVNFYGEGVAETLENTYKAGQDIFELTTQGGIDWLLVGLSYKYRDDDLEWLSGVLEQYPDRKAILILHDFMRPKGVFSVWAQKLLDEVILTHDNVRLVICGHYRGKFTVAYDLPNNHKVQIVFYNKQDKTGYMGSINFLTIDVKKSEVQFSSETALYPKTAPVKQTISIDLT